MQYDATAGSVQDVNCFLLCTIYALGHKIGAWAGAFRNVFAQQVGTSEIKYSTT